MNDKVFKLKKNPAYQGDLKLAMQHGAYRNLGMDLDTVSKGDKDENGSANQMSDLSDDDIPLSSNSDSEDINGQNEHSSMAETP